MKKKVKIFGDKTETFLAKRKVVPRSSQKFCGPLVGWRKEKNKKKIVVRNFRR